MIISAASMLLMCSLVGAQLPGSMMQTFGFQSMLGSVSPFGVGPFGNGPMLPGMNNGPPGIGPPWDQRTSFIPRNAQTSRPFNNPFPSNLPPFLRNSFLPFNGFPGNTPTRRRTGSPNRNGAWQGNQIQPNTIAFPNSGTENRNEGSTLTCTAKDNSGSMAVTFFQNSGFLSPRLPGTPSTTRGVVNTSSITLSGVYSVLLTRHARVESGCSADTLGDIIFRTWIHPTTRQQTAMSVGVLWTVRLTPGEQSGNEIPVTNIPFNTLPPYAGRGVTLCNRITTDSQGRARCTGSYHLCCKLGYDNQDAILP